MTTGQAPIRIKTGNALDVGETTSNVATNTAELEAMRANIDGKDVYPNTVGTEHLSAANAIIHGAFKSGSMMVGSGGVVISSAADGETPTTGLVMGTSALQLIKSGEAIVALDGATGDATFKGTIASGSTISGTMSTGSIAIGDGGVSIGSSTAGIGIMGNQIFCKSGGVTTILIDGDTGNVTANRFMLTADEDSTLDMSLGSLTIGSSTTVDDGGNGTTIADIITAASDAQATADGKVTTFVQAAAPTAEGVGDLWIETDNMNKMWRWSGSAWASVQDQWGITAYTLAESKITTYYSTTAPSTPFEGDLWVDTDDGNKLWRYNGSTWDSAQDAGAAKGATSIQPGGGVSVSSEKYITRIDMSSGLVISTASTDGNNARTNITSNGLAIYHATNGLTVQIDHTNGLWIKNHLNGGTLERASFVSSNGTENGYIMSHANAATGFHVYSPNSDLYIQTDGSGKGIALTTGGGDIVVSGGNIAMGSGLAVKGVHKTAAGNNKSNTTLKFYAASSSGGSPTTLHTVTFTDGLITSWA